MNITFPFFSRKNTAHVSTQRRFIFTKFFESRYTTRKKKTVVHKRLLHLLRYSLAILLSILVVYIKLYFSSMLGSESILLLLLSAVLLSAGIGGFGPGILTTVLCTAAATFYFFPSSLDSSVLQLNSPTTISIITFTIEGFVISVLLEKRKRSDMALKARIQQQAVLAQLAQYALASTTINHFFIKTSQLITDTLNLKYCKILELQPGKKTFILRGGIGWRPGLVGKSIVTAGINSQGGYTLLSDKPVIVKNLKKEKRFYSPELLMSHKIISGMSVIIPGKKGPYGVIGVHSELKRHFTNDDIYFVQAVANIMATAIEKKTSENDLRESEIRFKRLFDSNIIGTFMSTFGGKFLEANDALLELIGYSRQELREGKIHRDILTAPEYSHLSTKAVEDLTAKGVSDVYEKEYITKSNKRIPVLIAVSRINIKSDICVGFVLDISKQKELEKRKDEFISMASHELKTPITSLKVLTQFLQKKFVENQEPKAIMYLARMNKQVNTLTELVNDLLDITQMQTGKLQLKKTHIRLDELVAEVVDDTQTVTATHRIHLSADTPLTVFADPSRIAQVVINFLTNAIKYSLKNTDIIVRVEKFNQEARVSVEDFGLGIDEQYKERVFEQFFRVNDNNSQTYPGMGMGLFISREIITRHEGHIGVESKKGKGSTFSFMLPLVEA